MYAPGKLMFLLDNNPHYKKTPYEGTVMAHRRGAPGYAVKHIPEIQPVMLLGFEDTFDHISGEMREGEEPLMKIVFFHDDGIWETIVEKDAVLDKHIRVINFEETSNENEKSS